MRRLLTATALCIVAVLVGAGCTSAPRADNPPSASAASTTRTTPPTTISRAGSPTSSTVSGTTGSTPASVTSSTTPATEPKPEDFGREQISLSCDDSAGDLPTGDSANNVTIGGADLTGLRARQVPPLATDVGLIVPPGVNWYFRKTPVYVKAGAGPVTLTIHGGAGQFLSWVPASVWTSGSAPNLAPWAARSVTLEGCTDHGTMYLGGLLATDPSDDFEIATSGSVTDFAARVSLDAGGRIMSARPVIDGCEHARAITNRFPSPTDAVIGPLSYAGLRNYQDSPVSETNWNGGHFYKSGAQLPPGTSATVTIGDAAAGYAAIVTETGPATGSRSVTYRSCRQPRPNGSWWVGGLVLFGRSSACVPLTVTDPNNQTTHRTVVSLGAGTCAGQ